MEAFQNLFGQYGAGLAICFIALACILFCVQLAEKRRKESCREFQQRKLLGMKLAALNPRILQVRS